MTLEPGDLVLVPFPYTDLKSKKLRPALVMTPPVNDGRDVILCGITSNLANAAHSILIESADLQRGELKTRSRIKCTRVTTSQISIIRKTVGKLKPTVLDNVRKELRALLGA